MMAKSSQNVDPFLTLTDVTLRLYDRILFPNTHWRFLNDQHWAVIGGNGAGKSTLMRALRGQIPVVSGQITYHFAGNGAKNKSADSGTRPHDRIAHVSFDDLRTALGSQASFYQARWNQGVGRGGITVSDYLSESSVKQINPYQVSDLPKDSSAFSRQREQVIELLGIGGLLHKEIVQLSDGERRKTSIARALMRRPQLLILDNPLTGLDRGFRVRLTEIIRRLMSGALSDSMRVILVTARADEIPSTVTHVLLVENCQVAAQGPREAVLQTDIAQALIGRESRRTVSGRTVSGGAASGLTGSGGAAHRSLDRPPARSDSGLEILIEIKRANVSYGKAKILRDVDWTVRRGENWALLGPNGAGKTTLLSLILADHPQAYANHVFLFGKRRGSGESIWDIKRRIGWVAPELHLYYPRNITSLQVVGSGFYDSVGLYHACSPEQLTAARLWMDRLGLGNRADVSYAKLSEGEQRLLLLARALVKEPLLLILDEPCQGLDARNRARVRQIVDAVGSRPDTSVIYVTHNADELPRTIRHVLQLDQGRVVRARSSRTAATDPG